MYAEVVECLGGGGGDKAREEKEEEQEEQEEEQEEQEEEQEEQEEQKEQKQDIRRICVLSNSVNMGQNSGGRGENMYLTTTEEERQHEQEESMDMEAPPIEKAMRTTTRMEVQSEEDRMRINPRKPRLMIYEESMNEERRLWLDKVLGYWTEHQIKVEAEEKGEEGNVERGSENEKEIWDSLKLTIKTHATSSSLKVWQMGQDQTDINDAGSGGSGGGGAIGELAWKYHNGKFTFLHVADL
ncbi:hypothetical protein BG004_005769 [Podila humilis]|nr:hypothetical protein BG004_005769 [Podila humilis]